MKKRRDLKHNLRWFRDRFLWQKFLYNRGNSIWSDLFQLMTLSTIMGLFVEKVNQITGTHFSVGFAMMMIPPIMILYWITGNIDFYKFHLIQKENEIAMEANPALYDKIKSILRNTKKIKRQMRSDSTKKKIGTKKVRFY
jgi:hypothetical protein